LFGFYQADSNDRVVLLIVPAKVSTTRKHRALEVFVRDSPVVVVTQEQLVIDRKPSSVNLFEKTHFGAKVLV
jgi:hypothetical protein